MISRLGAVIAIVAVVTAGAAGYLSAQYQGQSGLSDSQRAEIDRLIGEKFDAAASDTITAAVQSHLRDNPIAADGSSIDQTSFGARVREYLVTNPEVISEAITELERKRAELQAVAQREALEENRELVFNSPRQIVIGNPAGSTTLVEFFDYNCTYCRRAQADMERLLEDPELRVVLKEFPVLGQPSFEAAQVSVAVSLIAPDSYKELHERLLAEDGPVDREVALATAAELGVDRAALEAAVEKPDVSAAIEESYRLAEALGISGTPAYVVGEEVVVGAVGYDQLSNHIATARSDLSTDAATPPTP